MSEFENNGVIMASLAGHKWTTDADVKAFQNVADFMLKTGMIENEVNVEDLFIK